MLDQEAFWDELLSYIEAHSVIPVVGPELIVVEHEGRVEPYRELLARQLAIRLKLPELGADASLEQVVAAYLAKAGNKRQSVYRELGDLASKLVVNIPRAAARLAGIRDLNLFASFCTDTFLAQAINTVRFGGRPPANPSAGVQPQRGERPAGRPGQ